MPETSSGMQSEARSRGARPPSGAKPRGAFEWNSLTTNRTNFHEWEAAASSYSRDRQALGVPRFSRAAAFLLDAMAALPQEWVKPEVDPPRICALPRGV
jgi:hypothetical protein